MRWDRAWAIARIDLKRLFRSRDYWIPMSLLAGFFFVIMPFLLLSAMGSVSAAGMVTQIGTVLESLPGPIRAGLQGETAEARASYAFAVYLLAPIAIIVPLTISSAVGANTIVGERERGTGEFLAHSPLTEREIYVGKLFASLIPGYLATVVGFAIYSVIVNLKVGPQVGGWFFPTAGWWVLILWVVPPFIAIALSVILWVSARVKSAAAAQQASTLVTLPIIIIAYAISSGLIFDPARSAFAVGLVAWIIAGIGLVSGGKAVDRERLLGIGMEGS
jgi:ABC-type Na+ efflux pump permease subunit